MAVWGRFRWGPAPLSSSTRRRSGPRQLPPTPDDAEAPAALLDAGPIRVQRCPVCLSGWPIVAGGRLRARPRPALTLRAFGSRTFPDRAPLRVTGKSSRPNLALHGPYAGPQLHYQKANKNRWQHPSNRSCTNHSGGGEMTARREILGTEYKRISQTPQRRATVPEKQRISSLEGEFATRDHRSLKHENGLQQKQSGNRRMTIA